MVSHVVKSVSLVLPLISLAVAACSSSGSSSSSTTNGVDDVKRACEVRATWKSAQTTACTDCISYATTPRCECTDLDYAGKCSEQKKAVDAEPTCAGVESCVGACARSDCACADTCYAGKGACRSVASAANGCVAEICATHCQ